MTKPVRLQLSRAKGFRLQELSRATNGLEAKSVARRARWSNPWRIGEPITHLIPPDGEGPLIPCAEGTRCTREIAIAQFRIWIQNLHEVIRLDLRGVNLACWCRADQCCHADTLLEIANA